MSPALTPQQQKFVDYLLALPPADRAKAKTAAALQAGYSKATARVQGARLWTNKKVVEALGGVGKPVTKPVTKPPRKPVTSHRMQTAAAPAPAPEAMPLEDRHQRFCVEYLMDGNATRAYQRVYPHSSYEAARRSAHELLTNPDISARIAELHAARMARLTLSADQVLEHIAHIATYDPREMFDADGRLKPLDELSPDAARMIAGFTTKATVIGEEKDGICVISNIKLPDRLRALEMLGKNHRLFVEKADTKAAGDVLGDLAEVLAEITDSAPPLMALSKRYKVIEMKPNDEGEYE
ncbi:terminase small subunit [Geomonas sp. RF6]|uniref:terminase small subunit n=1 Tax=Geomonas sp. RF6 TaxID=2897342 RepID=UPI001E5BD017|nr:terminase small subunit [Geomonas sp. RF6]UFS71383.1 terminase small subunit [Geomonas sp. RF6]